MQFQETQINSNNKNIAHILRCGCGQQGEQTTTGSDEVVSQLGDHVSYIHNIDVVLTRVHKVNHILCTMADTWREGGKLTNYYLT